MIPSIRWPVLHRGVRARAGRALLAAAVLIATGCASHSRPPVRPSPETLPPGSPLLSRTLPESDAWLRHYLMVGDHAQGLAAATAHRSGLAPRDPLVRAFQEALIRRQAGDYQGSNRNLEWAEIEVERRYTRSVSRAAASLLVNDGVIPYTPPAPELLMVPYYRMLNYLALGEMDGALVEARKANALLSRLGRDDPDRCGERGMLQYLAGLIQSAGRETGDALVSLRLAARSFEECGGTPAGSDQAFAADIWRAAGAAGIPEIADSIAEHHPHVGGPDQTGDLVLLLEHGYVAHRAEQSIHVPIFPKDVEGLESGDESGIGAAAGSIVSRLMNNLLERGAMGTAWDDRPVVQWAYAAGGAYILRLAWPAIHLEATRPAGVRVWVGDSLVASVVEANLSASLHEELEAQRVAILTRAVARGVVKYLASREIEKKADEKSGDVAAFLVGRVANAAANHLEQADLRGWSLLPDRISMIRARLPDGSYRVRVESLARDGSTVLIEDLGEVSVRSGELSLLSRRVWGQESGALLPAQAASHATQGHADEPRPQWHDPPASAPAQPYEDRPEP
jgi:uncharacterized protein